MITTTTTCDRQTIPLGISCQAAVRNYLLEEEEEDDNDLVIVG